MQCTAFIVFFLTLIAKICFANLTTKTFQLDESLIEASIEILESCYTDRFDTVGVAGPSAGRIIKSISARETVIPTTLISENSTGIRADIQEYCAKRHGLQVFVITVTDEDTLRSTLWGLGVTKWWNHMASFLLIDLAESTYGCSNAHKVLERAWKMGMLNSKFMCIHETKGRLIYTFNPFTSKAPGPWQQVNTYTGINGHVWTLFVREYDVDKSRCDGLDFDKTVDLGGYLIIAPGLRFQHEPTKTLFEIENFVSRLVMDSLNATWDTSLKGLYTVPVNIYAPFRSASHDIHMGLVENNCGVGFCFCTYPFFKSEIRIATHYPGHKSQLDKLISVLDKPSRFGVLAVLMITLLFFKFGLGQTLISAILNLVLLICNAALRNIPQRTAPRIYLAGFFIFVVTIQGIYSGKLASLLTKNVRKPNIDSLEDLVRSDHAISSEQYWSSYLDKSLFKGRFISYRSDPFKNLNTDAGIAHVWPERVLIDYAIKYNLHLSREAVDTIYAGYTNRDDWPLQERVSKVCQTLVESGILDLQHARIVRPKKRILESYERQESEPELKALTLQNLAFAFKILAIGLGCATMVFIVEVATEDWD